MTDQLIIGIDPGKAGGIAFFRAGYVRSYPLPPTMKDLMEAVQGELIDWKTADPVSPFAYIEKVHSSPQMGVTSAFTFGQGYGSLLMLLTCEEIPFEQVTPQKWQKAMGCMSKGDKNVTKRRAQELFPDLKITHATADALLIGEYGRRLRNGGI